MRSGMWQTGIPLLAAAALLQGCISTPRYARLGETTGQARAGLFSEVHYRIDPFAELAQPDCVAILPLEVEKAAAAPLSFQRGPALPEAPAPAGRVGQEPIRAYHMRFGVREKERLVRSMLYGFISPHAPRDVELKRIDVLIDGKAPSGSAARRRLARRLGCDWLLSGRITEFDVDYLGVYSNIRIGAELQLQQASSGRVIWRGRHLAQSREGTVPLSPMSYADFWCTG